MRKYIMFFMGILLSFIAMSDEFSEFDDFDDFSETSEEKTEINFEVNGKVGYEGRINFSDGTNDSLPFITLQTEFETSYFDIIGDFNMDKYEKYPVVEELFTRIYLNEKFQVELGKEKLIWGKGDKVHLVNNINGTDYRDFINGEYRDDLIGENMIRLIYAPSINSEAKFEFVYTPEFTPDEFATSGPWIPYSVKLVNKGLSPLNKSLEDFEPNIDKFKNDQAGFRFTNSASGLDYGFSYYRGYEKQPTIDKLLLYKAQLGDPTAIGDIMNGKLDVHYDRLDVFGIEASKVTIGGINGRFETAYYMTSDRSGNEANVKNDRIGTLIGGDRDLGEFGLHNMNFNMQVKTIFLLDKSSVEDNPLDTDYDENGDYIKNTIIVKLQDKFRSDTIKPSVKFIWNVEGKDYAIMPEIEYIYEDNLYITLGYNIYDGKETTEIGQYRDNDYIYLGLEYNF
ncbi:MAG: DUF1302 family protein [Psychrilyobacter sp.]|uniref:DUF1302 family protein n=1 Tax=Psychrilyobacter sp. TaxID=2586924 RepID=UPI003C71130F